LASDACVTHNSKENSKICEPARTANQDT